MDVMRPETETVVRLDLDDVMQLIRSGKLKADRLLVTLQEPGYAWLPKFQQDLLKFMQDVVAFTNVPVDKWPPDKRAMVRQDIDVLREVEGNSVTILCDNPDAETADQKAAVECRGDWTHWQDKRFYARTWQEALLAAAMEYRSVREGCAGELTGPDAPQFVHDCEHCQFLGQYQNHDLYYCPKNRETLIARFGSEGSKYTSGLSFISSIGLITEAARRAVAKGYLSPEREVNGQTVQELIQFAEARREVST